ncbi:MAG: DNA repair protein RadC [Spirochaetaceae bacterium]|nr:DNA repair protein RadC [Spirochaetaceae bacterium]
MSNNTKIKDLPKESRPREKLLVFGAQNLSDRELISIILGNGVKGKNLLTLSEEVLNQLDFLNYKINETLLMNITGLGRAKIAAIAAAIEFSRRILCPNSKKIKSSSDIYPYIQHFADRKQEIFVCASLNGANEIIAIRVVSIGLINKTLVHPREVFADPISDRAAAVIVCHNHPSGNLEASAEDMEITEKLRDAGNILGIPLLDHIIFSQTGYKSILSG